MSKESWSRSARLGSVIYQLGPKKIYEGDDGYVISEHFWLPGVYQTFEGAELAFSLPDEALQEIQNRKNHENRDVETNDEGEGCGGIITEADLHEMIERLKK